MSWWNKAHNNIFIMFYCLRHNFWGVTFQPDEINFWPADQCNHTIHAYKSSDRGYEHATTPTHIVFKGNGWICRYLSTWENYISWSDLINIRWNSLRPRFKSDEHTNQCTTKTYSYLFYKKLLELEAFIRMRMYVS